MKVGEMLLGRPIDVVLIVATKVEREAVLLRMTSIDVSKKILRIRTKNTYYVGKLGAYPCALVMASMGSVGTNSAELVCADAIQLWAPKAVIMPGIAFGRSAENQAIADVLVSDSVIPYAPRKVARTVTLRGRPIPANPVLLDRFRNAHGWRFRGPKGRTPSIREGALISGEELVNRATRKRQLFREFDLAIGGEMEGAGVSAAATRHSVPWILAKAICDWADGTKNDEHQATAANAAASLVEHVLSDAETLAELTFRPPRHYATAVASLSTDTPQPVPQTSRPPERARRSGSTARVGSQGAHQTEQLLRIVATTPEPMGVAALQELFPDDVLVSALRRLGRRGEVQIRENAVVAPSRIRRRILSNKAVLAECDAIWIRHLEPRKDRPEVAVLLAKVYERAGRIDDAAALMSNVSEQGALGGSSMKVHALLESLSRKSSLVTSAKIAADVLNALGLSQVRREEFESALQTFERLDRLSREHRLPESRAFASINRGIASFELGRLRDAERFYRETIKMCSAQKNYHLLGRATHNLGMLLLELEPDEGARLLKESLRLKTRHGDSVGMLSTMLGHANYLAKRRQYDAARKIFLEGAALADTCRLFDLQARALLNAGSAFVDGGDPQSALPLYRKARGIALAEEIPEVVRQALRGEAVALHRAGEQQAAAVAFRVLADNCRDPRERISAEYDVGVCLWRAGDAQAARQVARDVLYHAKRDDEVDFAVKAIELDVEIVGASGRGSRDAALLSAARRHEKTHAKISARLVEIVAHEQFRRGEPLAAAESTLEMARRLSRRATGVDPILWYLKTRYLWHQERGDHDGALAVATEIAQRAARMGRVDDVVAALDEQGICYQNLERFAEAERAHRAALHEARRASPAASESALNNFGLLLQRTERPAASLRYFEKATQSARNRYDQKDEANSELNRSLALVDLRRYAEAQRVLEHWRDAGLRLGLWNAYVRALHTLANISALRGDDRRAEHQYDRALHEAELYGVRDTAGEIAQNYTQLLVHKIAATRSGTGRVARRAYLAGRAVALRYGLQHRLFSMSFAHAQNTLRGAGPLVAEDAELLAEVLRSATSDEQFHLVAGIVSVRLFNAAHAGQDPASCLVVNEDASNDERLTEQIRWPYETGWRIVASLVYGGEESFEVLVDVVQSAAADDLGESRLERCLPLG